MSLREQTPRIRGLAWHDDKKLTRIERRMLIVGWIVAAIGTGIVIWSFF